MDFRTLNFTIFCVGSVADYLKMSAREVYHRLNDAGIISDYIVPCYDVLHTFSKKLRFSEQKMRILVLRTEL